MKIVFHVFLFSLIFCFASSTCPRGALESLTNKNICYLFNSTKQAFLNAEEICIQNGGHLASVENMFDNAFISEQAQQYFTDSTTSDFWIGANQLLTPGVWGWIDGSPFNFTDWDKGQPQNVSGNNCGSTTILFGTWQADLCYKEKSFVCAINNPTIPPSTKCPNNWSYFDKTGYCYFVGTNKTWEQSEEFCISHNSHLASIHSLDENGFVTNLIPFYPNIHECSWQQCALTGLFTVTNQTTWRWIDGTIYNYSLWAPGQPSCTNINANCGVVWNGPYCNSPIGTWAEGYCNGIYGSYICKKLP